MSRILLLLVVIILLSGVIWQYFINKDLTQRNITCGGDYSYAVICPIGSFCKDSGNGEPTGGFCSSYLEDVFPKKEETPVYNISEIDEGIRLGWNGYTNELFNFSFIYPDTWPDPIERELSSGHMTEWEDESAYFFSISYNTYFNQELDRNITLNEYINSLPYRSHQLSNVYINGLEAKSVTYTNPVKQKLREIIFEKDGFIYILTMDISTPEKQNVFDTILKSLTF